MNDIRRQIAVIRDEKAAGKNTSARIADALDKIVDEIEAVEAAPALPPISLEIEEGQLYYKTGLFHPLNLSDYDEVCISIVRFGRKKTTRNNPSGKSGKRYLIPADGMRHYRESVQGIYTIRSKFVFSNEPGRFALIDLKGNLMTQEMLFEDWTIESGSSIFLWPRNTRRLEVNGQDQWFARKFAKMGICVIAKKGDRRFAGAVFPFKIVVENSIKNAMRQEFSIKKYITF